MNSASVRTMFILLWNDPTVQASRCMLLYYNIHLKIHPSIFYCSVSCGVMGRLWRLSQLTWARGRHQSIARSHLRAIYISPEHPEWTHTDTERISECMCLLWQGQILFEAIGCVPFVMMSTSVSGIGNRQLLFSSQRPEKAFKREMLTGCFLV